MNYSKIIHGMLELDATFKAAIGARYYPTVLPEKTAYPAMAHTFKATPVNIKGYPNKIESLEVRFWLFSKDGPDELTDLAFKLRDALDNAGANTSPLIVASYQISKILFEMQDHMFYDPDDDTFGLDIVYSFSINPTTI